MDRKSYSEKLKDPRWQKKSGIYKIIINNNFYIGSAVDLIKRLRGHLNDLLANRHKNSHLQRALNKYGPKNITFEILEIVACQNQLVRREQHYINLLNPRYNIAPIAGSQLGLKHSTKTKQRISEMQKGKTISIETRLKMAESRKGKKLSKQHRENIALSKTGNKNPFYKAGIKHPQYGIPKSEITKRKISESLKRSGKLKGENNPASRSGVLVNKTNNKIYIFNSLKPLVVSLALNYKGLMSAVYLKRLYMKEWNVEFK